MLSLFFAGFMVSYNFSANDKESFLVRDIPTQAADASDEIIVSNVTSLNIEIYDIDKKTSKTQTNTIPIAYLGLTRHELIETLQDYMLNPSVNDKAHGLIACELVEFTKQSVTIRKTYSAKNLPQRYYIVAEKGVLVIYLDNGRTLYDRTDIRLTQLPQSVQEKVMNKMRVDSAEELYDFLETFTS